MLFKKDGRKILINSTIEYGIIVLVCEYGV